MFDQRYSPEWWERPLYSCGLKRHNTPVGDGAMLQLGDMATPLRQNFAAWAEARTGDAGQL